MLSWRYVKAGLRSPLSPSLCSSVMCSVLSRMPPSMPHSASDANPLGQQGCRALHEDSDSLPEPYADSPNGKTEGTPFVLSECLFLLEAQGGAEICDGIKVLALSMEGGP